MERTILQRFRNTDPSRWSCYLPSFYNRFSNNQKIQLRYKNYYSVLGLNRNASANDIKEAYYKLSFKYHPDKNKGSEDSAVKFREISEAYEVLGSQEKRVKYDNEGDMYSHPSPDRFSKQYPFSGSPPFKKRPNAQTGKSEHFDYDRHYYEHYARYEFDKRFHVHPIYRGYYKRRDRTISKLNVAFVLSAMILFYFFTASAVPPLKHDPIYYSDKPPPEKNGKDKSKI